MTCGTFGRTDSPSGGGGSKQGFGNDDFRAHSAHDVSSVPGPFNFLIFSLHLFFIAKTEHDWRAAKVISFTHIPLKITLIAPVEEL